MVARSDIASDTLSSYLQMFQTVLFIHAIRNVLNGIGVNWTKQLNDCSAATNDSPLIVPPGMARPGSVIRWGIFKRGIADEHALS
jgi:hypothetical protein